MLRRNLFAAAVLALSPVAAAASPVAAAAADPEKIVVIEAQVFKLGDASFRQLNIADLTKKNGTLFLDAAGRAKFLADVATKEDVQVVAAPKMSTFDGKPATVCLQQQYVYNESIAVDTAPNGAGFMVPKQNSVTVGLKAEFVPQVSADGRTVRLKYDICDTAVSPKTEKRPFTVLITPVFEGGSQGQPIPITQFVEKPILDTNTVQQVVAVPAGNSVLATVGSKATVKKLRHKVPVVGDIFLLGDLFRWDTTEPDVEHTFVVLTAKVPPAAEQPAVAATPSPVQRVMVREAAKGVKFAAAATLASPVVAPCPAATFEVTERVFFDPAVPARAVPAQRVGMNFTPPQPVALVAGQRLVTAAPDKNEVILKVLLEQYEIACKTGETAKAKTIAAYCLEMDPACFAKR